MMVVSGNVRCVMVTCLLLGMGRGVQKHLRHASVETVTIANLAGHDLKKEMRQVHDMHPVRYHVQIRALRLVLVLCHEQASRLWLE